MIVSVVEDMKWEYKSVWDRMFSLVNKYKSKYSTAVTNYTTSKSDTEEISTVQFEDGVVLIFIKTGGNSFFRMEAEGEFSKEFKDKLKYVYSFKNFDWEGCK